MQIITIEDQDFPALLDLFNSSEQLGNYTKGNSVQIVRANKKLVMVSLGLDPKKIAVRPVRNTNEAKQVAKRLLELEEKRGNLVNYDVA